MFLICPMGEEQVCNYEFIKQAGDLNYKYFTLSSEKPSFILEDDTVWQVLSAVRI